MRVMKIYLSSDFGREVLPKNKMKIRLSSRNTYYNDLNMREYLWFYDSTRRWNKNICRF